jgi:bifunctional non-homologous end joining protein LigD
MPIEERKRRLAELLGKSNPGLQFNEHFEEPGDILFRHACAMGIEGIVSKRKGSTYRSGRSRDWIKTKNPKAPAASRPQEEEWGKRR